MTDPEPDCIMTLEQIAKLWGVHVNTVRRNYRDKFVWISPRRCGMWRRDVLHLGQGTVLQPGSGKRPVSGKMDIHG